MIQVKHLSKKYNDKTIFENISFELPDNGLYLLCGPNGCGKSSLIYVLAGLDSDYSGDVIINDKHLGMMHDKAKTSMRKKDIGLLFSHGNLFSFLNVEENLIVESTDNLYEIPSQLMNKKISYLSGGEEVLVSLVSEFNKNKRIYLIDELTSALNDDNVEKAMALIEKKSLDSLIIMATHDERIKNKGIRIPVFDR